MSLINKNRLSLISQLIASCAVLAACGGGNGTDATASALSSDTSSTAAAAAVETAAASSATTDTTTDDAAEEALRRSRNTGSYGSNSSTTTASTSTASTTAATTTVAATTTATTAATTTATTAATTTAVAVASNVATTTVSMTSSTAAINNPERGFYGWGGSYLTDFTASSLAGVRSSGYSLTLGLIDLSSFRSQNISQSYLNTLNTQFALARAAGVKVVIRCVYNYDSSGVDATLSQVQAHLSQLASVFSANADVIGYVQAGFIGAWGEWHDSTNNLTSASNESAVRDAVLAAVPSQFPVQFRYPYDIIGWYPTALTASAAFNGSAQSRMSVHNDCFMSNDTDVGTYTISSLTNNSQRTYTQAITEYGPFGGETCSGFSPARMTCSDILSEGALYHLAYLNISYDLDFINSWKSGGCFDQVARTMGYRLQLDNVTVPTTASRSTAVTVNVNLHDVGWSRMFSARKLVVTLKNKSTGALITGTGSADMRTLPSQATASTTAPVTVTIPSSAAAGQYEVLLGMPDIYSTTASDARFAVQFANADDATKGQAWDATNARFDTGAAITVQ